MAKAKIKGRGKGQDRYQTLGKRAPLGRLVRRSCHLRFANPCPDDDGSTIIGKVVASVEMVARWLITEKKQCGRFHMPIDG